MYSYWETVLPAHRALPMLAHTLCQGPGDANQIILGPTSQLASQPTNTDQLLIANSITNSIINSIQSVSQSVCLALHIFIRMHQHHVNILLYILLFGSIINAGAFLTTTQGKMNGSMWIMLPTMHGASISQHGIDSIIMPATGGIQSIIVVWLHLFFMHNY